MKKPKAASVSIEDFLMKLTNRYPWWWKMSGTIAKPIASVAVICCNNPYPNLIHKSIGPVPLSWTYCMNRRNRTAITCEKVQCPPTPAPVGSESSEEHIPEAVDDSSEEQNVDESSEEKTEGNLCHANGISYRKGQQMPTANPCRSCICDERFDGTDLIAIESILFQV